MKESLLITALAGVGVLTGDHIENHSVSIGTLIAVCGVVLPAAWWLSRKLTRLDDAIEDLRKRVDSLPCKKECDL